MKNKQKKKTVWIAVALVLLTALVAAAVLLPQLRTGEPERLPEGTTMVPDRTEPLQTVPAPTVPPTTVPEQTVPEQTLPQGAINLGYGLQITDSGKYTGVYMEDGGDEIVSDVMMAVVVNTGEADVQLAEITAQAGDEQFRFRLTNLAVGERTVILDLDRKPSGGKSLESAVAGNTVLFQQPMTLLEDRVSISGQDGVLNIKNISDADIEGEIYVYYKYAAEDLYYGGITFRVRVEGGLKAGEIRQVPAGHYSPAGCSIVQVTIYD